MIEVEAVPGERAQAAVAAIDLSLVLACYNEEPLLAQSVEEILAVLECSRFSYEIIFVDDASADQTRQLIEGILKNHPKRQIMRAMYHEQNAGRGAAVRDGLAAAKGEIIGYLDVDLEIQPSAILACVLAIRSGADAAIAKRLYTFTWRSLDRHILSKGYAWLVRRVLGIRGLTDTESGCKFFKREKVMPLLQACEHSGWFWDTEIMVRCALAVLRIKEVPLLYLRRFDKTSSVRPFKDTLDYFANLLRFRAKLSQLRTQKQVIQ